VGNQQQAAPSAAQSDATGGLSRRTFLASVGVGAGAFAFGGLLSSCAKSSSSEEIVIGFVSPQTGALAGFGEPDTFVLDQVRTAVKNGIKIGNKTFKVRIVQKDTQSDPQKAASVAKELITSEKIDLMLTTSTPETVNPVSDACEAAGVPCVSTVMPWEAWYFGRGAKPGAPSPFKYTFHFCFGVAEFAKAYISQWGGPVTTDNTVGVMWPNDADGNAIRSNLGPALQKGGFTIVDPGAYEDGTTDFTAQITKFKDQKCEIFNTFPIPPDFVTFWQQAAQQGYKPKIVQVAKTGLFPSQIEALGDIGVNIASAAYWTPTFPYSSALLGLSSAQLGDAYQKSTGKQWNQDLGTTASLFEVGIAALTASGDPKKKDAVAQAMFTLKVKTMVGDLDWSKGPVPNVVPTPIIGGQWVKAKAGSPYKLDFVLTENAADPNVPVAAQLVPYA
jgi:branched-chain amino acid transport system substrate-binding protein